MGINMINNQLLHLYVLLLLQAAVGVPFAGVGIYTCETATALYWFCFFVFMFDGVIIINSLLNIISYLCGRKSEYEDIENGANAANNYNLDTAPNSFKKERRKWKKMKTASDKKQIELDKLCGEHDNIYRNQYEEK